MKKIAPENRWLESWKYSYQYDRLEIYGDMSCHGYAYAYANRRKHTLELVQEVAQPKAKILDVAAGQGNFTLSLAELGYEVTWNDLREELVDYVKLKWEHGIVHYAPGNVFTLDFESNFDIVLITEIIEHVAHPDEFLKKITRMVKPEGYVIMSTPNGEYFYHNLPRFSDCPDPSQFEAKQFQPNEDGHIFLLHIDEVESLAQQSDLLVVEARFFNNPLSNGYLKLGTLLKWLPRNWVNDCETFTRHLPLTLQRKIHTSMVVSFSRLA